MRNATVGDYLKLRILFCLLLMMSWRTFGLSVVQTQTGIKSFLGGQTGVLVFVDKTDGEKIKWIDLSDSKLSIHNLNSDTKCVDPILNRDGKRLVYVQGEYLYACSLLTGKPEQISKGVNGYWHRRNSADYLMYCDATLKSGYNQGSTYLQKIKNGVQPDSSRLSLYTKAYDAGITTDGRWMGETYGGIHVYDLVNKKEYSSLYLKNGATEGQCCNGSMALDGTHRMLALVLPHDYIRLFQFDASADRWQELKTYTKPPDTIEWQKPEYSTHGKFYTATAKQADMTYHLYLVNIETGGFLRVIEGDIINSHLSIEEPGSGIRLYPNQSSNGNREIKYNEIFYTVSGRKMIPGHFPQAAQCFFARPNGLGGSRWMRSGKENK